MMKISQEAKIGIIVTIAISLFIWGFNYLKGRNILKEDITLYAIYQNIDGLEESGPVFINGFKVGQVEDIYFHSNQLGNLIVEISVQGDVKIPRESIAKIFSYDIMGTKAINLELTNSDSFHQEGDTLLAKVEEELARQISRHIMPLKEKIERLVVSTDSIVHTMQRNFNKETQKNLQSIIRNLNHTTNTVKVLLSDKGDLGKTFSHVEEISKNFKENNKELSNTIKNFSEISDSLKQSEIISSLENSLAITNTIVEKIHKGEGSLGLLINNDSLYNNLQAASKNLDRLLIDIRKNPKKYVHFSAVDFGKKVYITEDEFEEKESKKKNRKRKNKE